MRAKYKADRARNAKMGQVYPTDAEGSTIRDIGIITLGSYQAETNLRPSRGMRRRILGTDARSKNEQIT